MKMIISFFLVLFMSQTAIGQVGGLKVTFDDGNLTGWVTDHPSTFGLSAEDGTMKINYNRSGSSGQWDNFNFTPTQNIDVSNTKVVSVLAKSTTGTQFTVKSIYAAGGDDFLTVTLPGDNQWHVLNFKSKKTTPLVITKFYLYLDGGATSPNAGTVWIDEFSVGDSVNISASLNWKLLEKSIASAQKLNNSVTEGESEGQFPSGSKAELNQTIESAETFQAGGSNKQSAIDSVFQVVLNACVNLEKSVISQPEPLVDESATWQTRNLYRNLKALTSNALLFGMHDAVGYGVGWSGNDNRSDVYDVVGDFPAFYSEDLAFIDKDEDWTRVTYRIESAYNRGGVISFCWHQLDPDGRGFYATDVNNEKIVASILPGGNNHIGYKEKLDKVGLFLKSLRGSAGESIPVVFRPYHEHIGNWFWWGTGHRTTEEYNQLWKFTIDYLIDTLNVHNMIIAISPNLDQVGTGNQYFSVFPGTDYVDIYGFDYYYSDVVSEQNKTDILSYLRQVAEHSEKDGKLMAFTEVGQEGLDAPNWFSDVILPPLKYDSLASRLIYAAVWRNANTTHHYAPYPGHKSVPDFTRFYHDPYTMFEQDLPAMYLLPQPDLTPPSFPGDEDSMITTYSRTTDIRLETSERAVVRYSSTDRSFDNMEKEILPEGNGFLHTIPVSGNQGDVVSFFLKAKDRQGNTMNESFQLNVEIDTLKAPVEWFNNIYSVSSWKSGLAPLGSGSPVSTGIQKVKTAYFRTDFHLDSIPSTFAVQVKSVGGMAIFVNGTEVLRHNMAPGLPLTFDSPAFSTASFIRAHIFTAAQRELLVPGKNTVSVEIHSSPEIGVTTFDAKIYTQNSTILPFSSGWNYFDLGMKPEPKTIGDIVSVSDGTTKNDFRLNGNYPNPFNPATTIHFVLPKQSAVEMIIFDVLGRKVTTLLKNTLNAGTHQVSWNAAGLSSGVYFIRLTSDFGTRTHHAVLLK